MEYKIHISKDARDDLDSLIGYICHVKCNPSAATSILSDYKKTQNALKQIAGSLKYCDNPALKAKGYKRINFFNHYYFIIFRIVDDVAIIDGVFHFLQDANRHFE